MDLVIAVDSIPAVPELATLFDKLQRIVKFFRFKGAEVSKKQKEIQALLDKLPDDENEELTATDVTDHSYAQMDHQSGNSTETQKSTTLKLDCKTRWNSKCILVQSIIDNFRVINELLDHHKSDMKLSFSEKDVLKQLNRFLITFKESSELVQRDLTPELSNVLPTIACLKLSCFDSDVESSPDIFGSPIENENDSDEDTYQHPVIAKLKKAMYASLQKRFQDIESMPVYKLASSLDPRWKKSFGFSGEDEFLKAIESFEISIGQHQPATSPVTSDTPPITSSPPVASGSKRTSSLSLLMSKMRRNAMSTAETDKLKNEVASYLSIPAIAEEQINEFNLLLWWKDHEPTFIKLSQVARKVFSIMSSAATNERLNSAAGRTITETRSSIAPQNVDMILFLHYNTPPEVYSCK